MGVSMTTVRALWQAGQEVLHLREEGLLVLPDDVLTFDLDFGELLASAGGVAPSVIIFSHA
jgi:hypothetical protein